MSFMKIELSYDDSTTCAATEQSFNFFFVCAHTVTNA